MEGEVRVEEGRGGSPQLGSLNPPVSLGVVSLVLQVRGCQSFYTTGPSDVF